MAQKEKIYTSPEDAQLERMLAFGAHKHYLPNLSLSMVDDWYNGYEDYIQVHGINGNVICETLWFLMSHNPMRFGTTSPFIVDGANDIYRFARGTYIAPKNTKSVLSEVRYHIQEFLRANGALNHGDHRWDDVVRAGADGGAPAVTRALHDALVGLFMAFRDVANQNARDFQTQKYHDSIVAAYDKLHPQPTHSYKPNVPAPVARKTAPTPMIIPEFGPIGGPADKKLGRGVQLTINFDIPVAEIKAIQTTPYPKFNTPPTIEYAEMPSDRELDAMDSVDIILGIKGSVSDELYLQALADKQYFDER